MAGDEVAGDEVAGDEPCMAATKLPAPKFFSPGTML